MRCVVLNRSCPCGLSTSTVTTYIHTHYTLHDYTNATTTRHPTTGKRYGGTPSPTLRTATTGYRPHRMSLFHDMFHDSSISWPVRLSILSVAVRPCCHSSFGSIESVMASSRLPGVRSSWGVSGAAAARFTGVFLQPLLLIGQGVGSPSGRGGPPRFSTVLCPPRRPAP